MHACDLIIIHLWVTPIHCFWEGMPNKHNEYKLRVYQILLEFKLRIFKRYLLYFYIIKKFGLLVPFCLALVLNSTQYRAIVGFLILFNGHYGCFFFTYSLLSPWILFYFWHLLDLVKLMRYPLFVAPKDKKHDLITITFM